MSEIDDSDRVKRRESQGNLARRRELADVQFILSTVEGRRFYWRLMRRCGIHKSSFTGNNTTFFQEGERNIGLVMLADLEEANPDAYVLMLKESKLQEASNG